MARQKSSILDLILDRTNKLKGELGSEDKAILDGYLENVRRSNGVPSWLATRIFRRSRSPTHRSASWRISAQVKIM